MASETPRKKKPKQSIHGSCTVDEFGYCDECGEDWSEEIAAEESA